MSIHSTVVDVSGTAAYPSDAQVEIPFKPSTIALINEDTADDAFVSFDGSTDHVHLQPGTPSAGLRIKQGVQLVWLRRGVVGSGPTNVQVLAEHP